MASLRPQVGNWYKDLEIGQLFEVVAIDDDTIETQLLEGELCEYDMESWQQLQLESVEEPEDWREVFELSDDDYRTWDDSTAMMDQWTNPLSEIESDVVNGILDEY
ncbi:hypothetical protein IB286_08720 [Spongiibacter sp. KMU-158]|uniref:Uncharacterized protein n=1 Tax=Spongiibacter pelagi TaxID=2760804 RepID=A0A927C3T2_9GAMM|nr:DUF6763 family protein [Spongiibacter pelagi]MBD2859091.1 hypothetical protein [Spongiibacter pelagi]